MNSPIFSHKQVNYRREVGITHLDRARCPQEFIDEWGPAPRARPPSPRGERLAKPKKKAGRSLGPLAQQLSLGPILERELARPSGRTETRTRRDPSAGPSARAGKRTGSQAGQVARSAYASLAPLRGAVSPCLNPANATILELSQYKDIG